MARVWHEFGTSLARVLHEFGTLFARVLHAFCTSFAQVLHAGRSGDEMSILFRAHACLISPACRAFVTVMSCACYSAIAGRGEWHEFGTSLARVLHEFWHDFCMSLRVQRSLAQVLHEEHEFSTSLAHILHEFCMRFARVLHEFGTSFARRHACALNSTSISSLERSNIVTGAVRSLRHAKLL